MVPSIYPLVPGTRAPCDHLAYVGQGDHVSGNRTPCRGRLVEGGPLATCVSWCHLLEGSRHHEPPQRLEVPCSSDPFQFRVDNLSLACSTCVVVEHWFA